MTCPSRLVILSIPTRSVRLVTGCGIILYISDGAQNAKSKYRMRQSFLTIFPHHRERRYFRALHWHWWVEEPYSRHTYTDRYIHLIWMIL